MQISSYLDILWYNTKGTPTLNAGANARCTRIRLNIVEIEDRVNSNNAIIVCNVLSFSLAELRKDKQKSYKYNMGLATSQP